MFIFKFRKNKNENPLPCKPTLRKESPEPITPPNTNLEESKEEGKESLTLIKVDLRSEDSSSEEFDHLKQVEESPKECVEARFTINNKFTKRMLVFKVNNRDKNNIYQGEVFRIRK